MHTFKRVLNLETGENKVLLDGVDISGKCTAYDLSEGYGGGIKLTLSMLVDKIETDIVTNNITIQVK